MIHRSVSEAFGKQISILLEKRNLIKGEFIAVRFVSCSQM